jgi:hypothetical protein
MKAINCIDKSAIETHKEGHTLEEFLGNINTFFLYNYTKIVSYTSRFDK